MAAMTPRAIDDGVRGVESHLLFEQRRRQQQMQDAWAAYRGEFLPPLKPEVNQPDDNVLVNRCAPVVDKGVSFLFGKVVKIELQDADGGTDGSGTSDAQDWLDAVWGDDDDKMTLLSKLALNGAICGQAFLKIVPANPRAGQIYPRLVVLDPQTVEVVTDPDDCDTVRQYTIQYDAYDATTAAPLTKRQIIKRNDPDGLAALSGGMDSDDTWIITNEARSGVNGAWQQIGAPQVWPYPFAPIVACQNLPNPNEYWGKADLTPDIIGMNRVLNFVESNVSRIIKKHAMPWPWASGMDTRALVVEPGRVIGLPHPEAKMGFLEINTAGLSASMQFAGDLRSDMDEQSRVPAVALGRLVDLPKGNISGVALQLLFQPLIEKTTQKQRLYGRLLRDVSRALLVLGKQLSLEEANAQTIDLHWQNLLPVDDLAAAQTALALSQVGVSRQTLLQQLGYDPDSEAEKQAEDTDAQATAFAQGKGPASSGAPAPAEAQPANAPQGAAQTAQDIAKTNQAMNAPQAPEPRTPAGKA